jgi:membrane protease YdiL (CAAX protease family)
MYEIEEPKLENKLWGAWATVGLGLVVFIVWSTVQALAVLAVAFPKLLSFLQSSPGQMDPFELMRAIEALFTDQMGLITSVSVCASAIFGAGLIVLFTGIRKGVSIAEYLGLKRITVKQVLAVLGITAGFIIISDGLGMLVDRSASNEFMVNTYNTSVWPALLWVSLIIFAPIFEEAFFRGFLFEGFRQSRLGPVGAIGLTALAWAALHIQYNIYDIAVIFIMGVLFGVVRIKTGSLWSTIIMHAFTNMVATILIALQVEGIITWPV